MVIKFIVLSIVLFIKINVFAVPFLPPNERSYPEGPLGEAIAYGHKILTETEIVLPKNVGASLRCTSCHLNAGRTQWAAPWVGITASFPQYRDRAGRITRLEDRVNECFERSLNGKPLSNESKEMLGIISYMAWLSKGVPVGEKVDGSGFFKITPPEKISAENGKTLYLQKCASCHKADGSGTTGSDGRYLYPPLWGNKSFNIAAGMARLNTAAAFIYKNMPFQQAGSLSVQEAYDIAAYFTEQPRPDFKKKKYDWPLGNKPKDARY